MFGFVHIETVLVAPSNTWRRRPKTPNTQCNLAEKASWNTQRNLAGAPAIFWEASVEMLIPRMTHKLLHFILVPHYYEKTYNLQV
jgi:hypothetical protein